VILVAKDLAIVLNNGSVNSAVVTALAAQRFRPIMMTTLSALLGAIPLAIGGGEGAELRRPLGLAIVGGLLLSQALTLFTTPAVYLFFDRLKQRRVRTRRAAGNLPEHWLRLPGTVIDASRPQRIAYVTPDGRRVQLRGTLDPSYEVGQVVQVLVDPVDPTRARLVGADHAALSVGRTMIVLGTGSLLLAVVAFIVFG
jgi:hypothetical protein